MTFYLIGLGLNLNSISLEAKEALTKCKEIYLESYTIDFPYETKELESILNTKLKILKRESVEDESILNNAKTKNIALLVYGDPFSATTHHQLILSCKKQKIPVEIFHNASIMNSIAETGLSLYKFGKTVSMPTWTESYRPKSFVDYIKENQSVKAHSLLLIDIGLEFQDALSQLEETLDKECVKTKKILVCSRIGTPEKKFYFDIVSNLKKLKDVKKPFCFIIPSEMHFIEKEFLELL
jgi:diphthine methyl ester synthase